MNIPTPPSAMPPSRWIAIARAAWVAVALLAVTLFVVGLPILYDEYRTLSVFEGDERNETYANLAQLGLSVDFYAGYNVALGFVFATACLVLAMIIFVRKSGEPSALFVALTLVLFGPGISGAIEASATLHPVLNGLVQFLASLDLACIFLFFYLFPDGRFVPRWTRWLAVLLIAWAVLTSFPDSPFNPENWPEQILLAVFGGWLFTGGIAQFYRYRRVSIPPERQQTKWVITGFMLALAGSLALKPFNDVIRPGSLADLATTAAMYCFMLLIPLSLAIAILRYRLWDIDVIINRTLVYGTLTASVVGLYVLVVQAFGVLLSMEGDLPVSLLATGLIAVLFTPLRLRLQRGVNRLMYGERDDPYAVLSRLGRCLETTLAPGEALSTIVETVAQALKLPYAAIALKQKDNGWATAAEYGTPVSEPVVVPLAYQREPVGQLVLAPRAPGEAFSPSDRRLLEDLARQTGVAVHAVRLTADLQRSRERLVTAREEERRRMRRDLHDGLGPQLASLTMMSEAAHDLVSLDPVRAREILKGVTEQAREAITDVRRLVYALRPPALDTLGLMGALRSQVPQDDSLRITIEGPEDLPTLPAAVEVAVYRVALEALTNVVRHAKASNCFVRLTLDEETGMVKLEVEDDGRGIGEDRSAGVGLTSMRERAEELGGSCSIVSIPSGGTRVCAFLPYALSETMGSKADEPNFQEA